MELGAEEQQEGASHRSAQQQLEATESSWQQVLEATRLEQQQVQQQEGVLSLQLNKFLPKRGV